MNQEKLFRLDKLFLILFLLTSSFANSQIPDSIYKSRPYDTLVAKNELLSFPAELYDVNVIVASKREEKLSAAPSTISVYSASDIENFGYYTLSDLASITSGYSVNYQYGEAGFETRGQTAGGFNNNKHLLLIDGIPVNFARSYKAQIQEELPLLFAQRIEFLKGPASALYGVSAFYGVVSMLSKVPSHSGTIAESKFSAGTWDRNRRFMANVAHRSNSGITSLNVGYFHKLPSGEFVGVRNDPNYRYWDRNNSIFIKANHQFVSGALNGLNLGLIYMERNGGLGETWHDSKISSEVNNIIWRTFVPYIKYNRQLNSRLTLNFYAKGNNSVEEGQFQWFEMADSLSRYKTLSNYRSDVVNGEVLAELRYEINARNSLIGGFNYDRRYERGNPYSYAYYVVSPDSINSYPVFPLRSDFSKRSFYFNTVSGYAQYQKTIPFLSGLIVTAGLRYDLGIIDNFRYSQLSPRIAAVQKLSQQLNLKVMTGRALRAPGIKELGLTAQFLDELKQKNASVPELEPFNAEVIQSSEAGLNLNLRKLRSSFTVFYNETYNELRSKTLYVPSTTDSIAGNWIENVSGITSAKGFEVEVFAVALKNIQFFSNYSYAIARDQSGNHMGGVPRSRLNTGVTFIIPFLYNFRATVISRYIDGYYIGGRTENVNAGHTFFDANLILPVYENLNIEFQVRNIFNERVKFPPTGIPLPGRTYQLTMAVRF